tara:strand:- start:806 stop:1210 length:405 start_codon:yes stop_codon:yes gene_type:complete
MLFRLFLLFALVPLVELAMLVRLGSHIGVPTTIALVLATGAAGAFLARSQGIQAWQRLQSELAAGRFPGEEIFDGVLVLGGGLLLLTPGLITDLIGFAALIPGTRALIKSQVKRRIRPRQQRPGAVHAEFEVKP